MPFLIPFDEPSLICVDRSTDEKISLSSDIIELNSNFRMNVARYKIYNLQGGTSFQLESLYRRKPQDIYQDSENDLDVLDSKSKASGRYCSSKYSAWERHKGFKRLKIFSNEKLLGLPPDFILMHDPKASTERYESDMEIEESWEDEMIRRTREFNKRSRDSPHDARVWIEFADFQVFLVHAWCSCYISACVNMRLWGIILDLS